MQPRTLALVILASFLVGACTAPDTSAQASSDLSSKKNAAVVRRALVELDAQMDAYSAWYDDSLDGRRQNGARISGCWANPAGKDLTDVQKAFYCSMPLEFRMCNTVVLLETKATKDVGERRRGYLACKAEVAGVMRDPSFHYSADVDAAYLHLFLEQDPAWSPTSIVAEKRPDPGRPFPALLAAIADSLAEEGVELGLDALAGWAAEVRAGGGA